MRAIRIKCSHGTNCTIPPIFSAHLAERVSGTCRLHPRQQLWGRPQIRIGYAQQWNLDLQRNLPFNIQMSLDYTGVKGTHLDVAQAPNRTETGLRIASVQPFTWDTSVGNSIYNGGVLQLNRGQQGDPDRGNLYLLENAR